MASSPPRIEFGVTPRFDVFYALYTLSSATPSPLDGWKSIAVARLSRDFVKDASRIAPMPIFWPLLADAAQEVLGEISFDELVDTIAEAPVSRLQQNVLSGIFHGRDVVTSLLSGEKSLKQIVSDNDLPGGQLLSAFGLKPYHAGSTSVRAINSLLKQPAPFRDQLVSILRSFWNEGFHADWNAIEPALRDESFRMRDVLDEGKSSSLDAELNLPVALDDAAQEIRPKAGTPLRYQQIERCYVIPSAFNTRKWWTKYETSAGKVILYFPVARDLDVANRLARDDVAPNVHEPTLHQEIDAESVFRALGDTTRYAIASILARNPTTSAQLARSLKVSKPTITHHVQAMRSAGLIRETPSGGSTKLSLSRDTVAALSGAAMEQLFSARGELTLGTTRRRRNG